MPQRDLAVETYEHAYHAVAADGRVFHGDGANAAFVRLAAARTAPPEPALSPRHGGASEPGRPPRRWLNTLPVGGIVAVPEASSGCTSPYPVRASLALCPHR